VLVVNCHPEVARIVQGSERDELRYLMDRFNKTIQVKAQTGYHQEQFDIYGRQERGEGAEGGAEGRGEARGGEGRGGGGEGRGGGGEGRGGGRGEGGRGRRDRGDRGGRGGGGGGGGSGGSGGSPPRDEAVPPKSGEPS
jgi:ribonuclease G